jgi:hypothetical protein
VIYGMYNGGANYELGDGILKIGADTMDAE